MSQITVLRASSYLGSRFSEINAEIRSLSKYNNFPGVLQAVVNNLKQLVAEGRVKMVSRRIRFVGWVYQHGDHYIRYIIENLFVRSFQGIKKCCTINQWDLLYTNLPKSFKTVYRYQQNEQLFKIE